MTSKLSIPAVRQILAKLAKGEKDEEDLVEKIENSCIKFDHDKKGVRKENVASTIQATFENKMKFFRFRF